MMRNLGKFGSAVILSFLCLIILSTGAFAQSASYTTEKGVAQVSTTQMVKVAAGNQNRTYNGWGRRFGHVSRGIRVTRSIRVTRIIRVTRVKITRVTRTLRVTRWIHQTRAWRTACGFGCGR